MVPRSGVFWLVVVLVLASVTLAPQSARVAAGEIQPTTTIYLPNIVKMLGGADGWNTPFIVQNVGSGNASVSFEFYRFSDGGLVKTRNVTGLAPGTSVFHSPNHDPELAAGGQYSVVVKSLGSPIVAIVNEHQNEQDPQRQEALSYDGLTSGSTRVYLPYVAAVVGGWYCTVIMQNLGFAAASVAAGFKSFDGTKTAQLTRSIPAAGSKFIDPRFESALVAGTEYAISLTSDQPIGVVVNCHDDDATVAAPRAFSYDGVPATSQPLNLIPYIQRNVQGSTTRVMVQNVGITTATPALQLFRLGVFTPAVSVTGPSLAAGSTWAFDPRLQAGLSDGEYSVKVTGGQFGTLAATTGPTSASGATGTALISAKLYLPNITRTLGGAQGWTTPINVQSNSSENATLRWYRFADGALVHTQLLLFDGYGQTIRVDPRTVAALSDDTQYAVVVTSEAGLVAVSVSELSFRGGDGAMSYEAVLQPPTTAWGTSYCVPESAPVGTTVQCAFAGLTPGSAIDSLTITRAGGSPQARPANNVVGADGLYYRPFIPGNTGQFTVAVVAGGATKSATFTVTPASFPISITSSTWGAVTAMTNPGLPCLLDVLLPNGEHLYNDRTLFNHIADATGKVSWTYTKPAGVTGSGTHSVYCTSPAGESWATDAEYTAP
jgi:hypothetical protein